MRQHAATVDSAQPCPVEPGFEIAENTNAFPSRKYSRTNPRCHWMLNAATAMATEMMIRVRQIAPKIPAAYFIPASRSMSAWSAKSS